MDDLKRVTIKSNLYVGKRSIFLKLQTRHTVNITSITLNHDLDITPPFIFDQVF